MKRDVLYATGSFEVGDTFFDGEGNPHVITDVLVCHYLRSGTFKVAYEVDGSGEWVDLVMKGFENDMPTQIAKPPVKNKPILYLRKIDPKGSEGGAQHE